MKFHAKVLTRDAAVETVALDAANPDEARRKVESGGARVLALRPQRSGFGRPAAGAQDFNLLVFNQQLLSLLDAGQALLDCIEILGRHDARGRHRSIYDGLLEAIRSGKQLSEAMAQLPSVFPPLYVAMLKSSETTGSVRTSIQRFIEYQKQIDGIRGKLIAAAIYPAILIGVGLLVVGFLMLYVVPRFAAVFDDMSAQQRLSHGLIQVWGLFVREHTLVAWGLFIAAVLGPIAGLAHPATRQALLRRLPALPWIGERIAMLQLARLYRTLGMLLKSGVSLVHAMRMAEGSMPAALQARLALATAAVTEGRPLSVAMGEQGLSTEVARRLLVAGESSGGLTDMLHRIADFYDQEIATWIDTVGRFVEPVLMAGIGVVIGAIVLMLYMPIFDLASAI